MYAVPCSDCILKTFGSMSCSNTTASTSHLPIAVPAWPKAALYTAEGSLLCARVPRFTWDVIKKHRRHRAIVLTTHSMEEADVLCDRIAIMVEGRLAAVGTSMDLKSQFGVGYTLTVVKTRRPHSADAGHHIAR